MGAWPKDDAGWPKKMSAEDEAAYVAGLSEKERHCVVGLGGSQKAEVAWLDAHGIPYEELDVGEFSLRHVTLFQSERAAEAAGDSNKFFANNPMVEVEAMEQQRRSTCSTTFNVNPGAVSLDNKEGDKHGTQSMTSWSVSHIESESGNEVNLELEVGGHNERQEGGAPLLPTNTTDPMLDRQHTVTHTAAVEERAVL
jgi:hypothetical protein